MTTTEAPFVNVIMLPNWGQYHPLDPIRAVFYEGTLYILTQDIDNALQKPGHRHTKRVPPPIHHPQNRQTQRRTLQQIHSSNHHRPTNTLREHARTTPTTKRKHALMDKNHSLRRPPKNRNMAPTHRHRMGKPQSRSQKNRHRIHTPRRMGRRLHHMRLLPRIPKPPRSARVRNSARRQSCIPCRSRK